MNSASFQEPVRYIIGLLFTILVFTFSIHAQNNALDFDGYTGDDYVSVPSFSYSGSNLTVETWVKLTTVPNCSGSCVGSDQQRFITFPNENLVMRNNDFLGNGALQVYFKTSNTIRALTVTNVFTADEWVHIAMTWNGTNFIVYVNGQVGNSSTPGGTLDATSGTVQLGINSTENFDGTLDNTRIWSVARTQQQIQENMTREFTSTQTNLLANWNFNEGTAGGTNTGVTTISDLTGTYDGTLNNFALTGSTSNFEAGHPTNNALDFDGADDYVTIGDVAALDGASQLTFEAWIKPETATAGERIFSKETASSTDGTGMALFGASGDQLFLSTRNGVNATGTTGSVLTIGSWNHVAYVFDGSGTGNSERLKCYVNGVEQPLTIGGTIPATLTSNAQSLTLGVRSILDFRFDGEMDEVRFWSVARTCSEILSTKDVELTGSESNLIVYNNFNHGAAGETNTGLTNLPDFSGNGNDGTLTNFGSPISGSTSNWVDGTGNNVSNSTTPVDQPEINVQGNSNDIADGSTTINATIDTDFGTQTTGTQAIVYTIQNTGTGTLNISSITSTGTNAGDFVVSGAPTTVAASGSETFTVTFDPLATGTRNATITINSDDCDEAAYDFAVQGVGDTNHAIDFDGIDDNITVSGFAAPTASWTYEFLFSPTSSLSSSDARQDLFYYGTGGRPHITFNRQGDGSLGIHTDIGGATQDITTTTTTWTSGVWYHVAFSYDGTAVKAYVNGAEQSSVTVTGASSASTVLNIGSAGASNYFAGKIDEVRIWNISRACAEILSTKDVELVGNESGLVAYYNFNQNEAGGTNTGQTTLDDLTSNNNDGTLTNFALTGSSSNWVDGSGNTISNSTTPINQPEINVQGNGNDIADGSTVINATINTDFGTQTSSNAIVYTIQNTGTGTLNISSVTSTGTNAGDFVVSGAPTTVAASGSESFTVTFTPAGAGTRSATITINSDDCDEATYDFAVQGSGPAPGGIATDLQLWLKGGFGFTASQWNDQSGNGNHAVQGTASAQPSSAASQINFNGATDFDGSDYMTLTNNASTMGLDNSDYELFFVANSSSTDIQFLISSVTQERYEMHVNGVAGHRFIPANNINFSDIGTDGDYTDGIYRIFGGTLQNSGASAASHVNGLFTTDIETAGLQTAETGAITIGRRESNDFFHWLGQIGEVLIYGDAMTNTQRQQVFTYLAVRHGITLDQSSATDYLAADGGIVWNATTNASYNNDIAGLARDDASELDQRQSGSLNTSAIIQLANGQHVAPSTYSNDDSWLIWGHDGGATTFGVDNIDNINATSSNRMTRIWRVQETGTVGSVQIRFSNSLGTGTVSIVSHTSDPSFPADGDRRVIEMTDDGTYYLGEIDLADGEYFSFANANYATLTSQFVVINEVITDPQQDWGASNFFDPSPGGSGDADDEWIELYITTDDLDLTSWTIEMNDGTDETGSLSAGGAFNQSNYRSLTGGFLNKTKAGDYLILGDPASGMMNATGGLTVILKDGNGGTIDQVTIATGSGTGFSGSATGTTDESVARIPNGSDTDIDATDFVKTLASLGSSSSPVGTVLINEIVTDPFTDWGTNGFDGTDGGSTVSSVDEWIELFIATDGLNLTGWTISLIDGSGDVIDQSISAGGAFAINQYFGSGSFISTVSGDYLVLGNPGSGTTAMNNDVQIVLKDASGNTVDQVKLGGGAGEAPSGLNSAFVSEAVVRYPNAADTDTDDADFVQTRPTLGGTNSPTGTVLINEVVTDPQQDWSTNDFDGTIGGNTVSSSDTDEWVELYIGTTGINLTGWTISLEDGSGDIVDQSLVAGGAFSTSNYLSSGSGYFENTETGDFLVLGNPSGSGTVQMNNDVQVTLKDASGNTIDQVKLGGGSGEAPSGSATGISDEAIARIPNGTNTANNTSDFIAGPATLGEANQTAQLPGIGNSIQLDGANDFISIPTSFPGTVGTISFWMNAETIAATDQRILCTEDPDSATPAGLCWAVNPLGGDSYSIYIYNHSNAWEEIVDLGSDWSGAWHNLTVVFNATTLTAYWDGIEQNTLTASPGFWTDLAEPENIGLGRPFINNVPTTFGSYFDGFFDEFRMWSDARTQEEILENMRNLIDPSTTNDPNLLAYYRFDQSSGTSLPDLTSNNNDGTLTNMAGTEWTAAGWEIFAQNATILQSGGVDVSTGTSGELTLTDVSFLNDDNDLLLAGHDNGDFSEVTTDLPSGTLLTARYDRTWNLSKNDASGTSNGSVKLGFNLGATPDVTYTYYLLERTGTSGDFAIVPSVGMNPDGNSMEFTVDASAIDDGSYYTLGRSDTGVGNALDFDGSNDYVEISDDTSIDFDVSDDFTIETWIKIPSTAQVDNSGTRNDFISKWNGSGATPYAYNIRYRNDDNRILAARYDGSNAPNVTSVSTFNDDQWHHLAFIKNGSSLLLYVDGLLEVTNTDNTSSTTLSSSPLTLGARFTTNQRFTGELDEVRIWSDARTQQEILDNMFTNLTGDEPNLAAYYRFNQGIGDSNTSLPDLSPNGNGGTLTNFDNLGSAIASSNYLTSTRSTITTSAIISNGGNLTATDDELTLTSTQTAGDFLQDANDFMRWNNDGGTYTETTSDVPATTQITARYAKTWQIEKNDAVGTANGNVTFTFDLGTVPDPDYTYFLLSRSGTSGDFSIVEALVSSPSGNSISFIVDAAEVTNDHYFTLGRTDAGAGNALDFDGTDDYVDLGTSLNTLDDFTWEFWINFAGTSPQWFFAVTDGTVNERIQVEVNAGQVFFGLQSNSNGQGWTSIGGGSISSNTWYHVAVTNSSTTGKQIYVDGILVNSSSNTISPTELANNPSYAIGRLVNATDYYWDGQIDEVRIWSDVRSEQEIRNNMNRKLDVANESNLVGYYQFNTGIAGGTNTGVDVLTDRSGNGNSGTLTNYALSGTTSNWVASTATVGDQTLANSLQGAGNALNFDGVEERVTIPDDNTLDLSTTITLEAWINTTNTNEQYILAKGNTYYLSMNVTTGKVGIFISSVTSVPLESTTNVNDGNWHHVAATFNSSASELRIFVDGIEENFIGLGDMPFDSVDPLEIGSRNNTNFFSGQIDEVRVWNTTRSSAEIQANMFESLTGSETGLVAYYNFDQSSGTSLPDESANSNTGTLNNMEDQDWVNASAREPFKTNGPGNLNAPATWVGGATPGASQKLYVQHDLTVDADLTVDDLNLTSGNTLTLGSGQTLTVTGNLVNNGTITGDGKIQFTTGSPMISGGTFSNLEMNGGSPILCGSMTMTGTLTLTSGNLQLDNFDLTMNTGSSISGGSSTSYIQTINNSIGGGGSVTLEIGSSDGPVTYPIGTETNYTPISFTNLGSTATFAIRTFDGIYAFNNTGAAFTENVISKTWDVNATGSGFNVTLNIQWNTADETTGFDRTNMYISTNDGNGWTERAGPLSATEVSSGIYQATASGISSFSGVGAGGDVITPVTLLDFYALQVEEGIELVWHTATEIDNEKFVVERSADGLAFEAIDEVAGNGDSEDIIEYRYTDTEPLSGANYYRLKQIDYDGDFEYSPIVLAEAVIEDQEWVVYPNPFTDRLYIGLKEAGVAASIKITGITGQVIFNESMISDNRFIQLDNLDVTPGLYILEIQQGEEMIRMRIVNE